MSFTLRITSLQQGSKCSMFSKEQFMLAPDRLERRRSSDAATAQSDPLLYDSATAVDDVSASSPNKRPDVTAPYPKPHRKVFRPLLCLPLLFLCIVSISTFFLLGPSLERFTLGSISVAWDRLMGAQDLWPEKLWPISSSPRGSVTWDNYSLIVNGRSIILL